MIQKENFDQNIDQYMNLLETNRTDAMDFYYEHLINPITDGFTEKVNKLIKSGTLKKYKYLIMTVGFSPEPLIMWIRAFRPEKVFFILTDNTLGKINEIAQYGQLRFDQVLHYKVNSSDTAEIYKQIKEIIDINHLDEYLAQTAIDITGGKKSMVSAGTLAANYLGVDVLYVDYSTYHQEHRKPRPGTEVPTILEDPLEVFGDRELEKGIAKFNSGDFDSASEIFAKIKGKVIDTRKYEMYELLSNGYKSLEGMKFKESLENIQKAIEISQLIKNKAFPVHQLQTQLEVIRSLENFPSDKEMKILSNKKLFWHIYGFIFFMAKHHMSQKKLDHAALLIYRCLEMSVQYLLLKYGIYASKAKYDELEVSQETLLERINEVGKEVYGASNHIPRMSLPKQVTLMFGLQILKALEEPVVKNLKLQKILTSTETRNKSIFAHGFQTIALEDVFPFYKTVINQVGEPMWRMEKEELGYGESYPKFEEFLESFGFTKL